MLPYFRSAASAVRILGCCSYYRPCVVSDKPVWQMGLQTRLAKDIQPELGMEPRSSVQPFSQPVDFSIYISLSEV